MSSVFSFLSNANSVDPDHSVDPDQLASEEAN